MKEKPAFRALSILFTSRATHYSSEAMALLRRCSEACRQKARTRLGVFLTVISVIPAWAQMQTFAHDLGAESIDSQSRPHLLGEWGGARSAWAEKGHQFRFLLHYRCARHSDQRKTARGCSVAKNTGNHRHQFRSDHQMARTRLSRDGSMANWRQPRRQDWDPCQPKRLGKRQHHAPRGC
jgi:hypothetical protein